MSGTRSKDTEFTLKTRNTLAERAGFECSVPGCGKRTIGPGADADETSSIGRACHIYSAGVHGPRGRGGLTEEQLSDLENGFWACADHGDIIDNNKGKEYPVGLLKYWKELHEEKIRNLVSGLWKTTWIEEIHFHRSPLFVPDLRVKLGKVTVLSGQNGVGKSAVCEWVSALRQPRLLDRWTRRNSRDGLDMTMKVGGKGGCAVALSIERGGPEHWRRDGVRQVSSPFAFDVVYLHQRSIDSRSHDDVTGLAEAFGVDRATIEGISGAVSTGSSKRFRDMVIEDETDDEYDDGDRPAEGQAPRDVAPRQRLVVETYHRQERRRLTTFGGGVQAEVLLAFAAELARHKSVDVPTVLVIDAGSWGLDSTTFRWVADVIDDCSKCCQVILIEPMCGKHRQEIDRREWVQYVLSINQDGQHAGLTTITPR
ncbi:hypothetical protein [Lichenibacterium ramalinae]|uniref:Rad50/SbcC-type AAA domain-containing protein n=1 Tax=Lichenibacterium ramalinae TaxID=2316527 RepID=A0A4Q2RCI5_9HYPH|nr:hypothetical protein [Lichenibacterium ramalinae]RYB04335.1 hypothetical protein D3272_12830 [Lichenibacterium ramalinae]